MELLKKGTWIKLGLDTLQQFSDKNIQEFK
jgi:hypothetical protein